MTNNPQRLYGAFGVAIQAGCLTVMFILGALLVGLWLDQLLGTRRIIALICVIASAPVSLFIVLRITQRLIARIIPPSARPTAGFTPSQTGADSEDDQP